MTHYEITGCKGIEERGINKFSLPPMSPHVCMWIWQLIRHRSANSFEYNLCVCVTTWSLFIDAACCTSTWCVYTLCANPLIIKAQLGNCHHHKTMNQHKTSTAGIQWLKKKNFRHHRIHMQRELSYNREHEVDIVVAEHKRQKMTKMIDDLPYAWGVYSKGEETRGGLSGKTVGN